MPCVFYRQGGSLVDATTNLPFAACFHNANAGLWIWNIPDARAQMAAGMASESCQF